ncbi:hypothetical protein BDV06DRAFT_207785 [Aspergillus oleicola]
MSMPRPHHSGFSESMTSFSLVVFDYVLFASQTHGCSSGQSGLWPLKLTRGFHHDLPGCPGYLRNPGTDKARHAGTLMVSFLLISPKVHAFWRHP